MLCGAGAGQQVVDEVGGKCAFDASFASFSGIDLSFLFSQPLGAHLDWFFSLRRTTWLGLLAAAVALGSFEASDLTKV